MVVEVLMEELDEVLRPLLPSSEVAELKNAGVRAGAVAVGAQSTA